MKVRCRRFIYAIQLTTQLYGKSIRVTNGAIISLYLKLELTKEWHALDVQKKGAVRERYLSCLGRATHLPIVGDSN